MIKLHRASEVGINERKGGETAKKILIMNKGRYKFQETLAYIQDVNQDLVDGAADNFSDCASSRRRDSVARYSSSITSPKTASRVDIGVDCPDAVRGLGIE